MPRKSYKPEEIVADLLRRAGWLVNDKRAERIWRREGLRVPARRAKRARAARSERFSQPALRDVAAIP